MQNLGKDILKNFGWLDLGRKVYPREDGLHIRLPITKKFSAMFLIKQGHDGMGMRLKRMIMRNTPVEIIQPD